MLRTGILLINTGSPASPTIREVRRFLSIFLMDPYVIDLPFWKRWLLVHGIILRTRPRHSAAAYQTIWTPQGSPLHVISKKQQTTLQQQLKLPVALGFRYGSPSIKDGFTLLHSQSCNNIIAFPLFPQYSLATTESIYAELKHISSSSSPKIKLKIVPPFWNHPAYQNALADSVKQHLPNNIDHLLISFHGLPERHLRKADPTAHTCLQNDHCCESATASVLNHCYRAQAIRTAQQLATSLNLSPSQYSISWQSRLGKKLWLQPSTHETVIYLVQNGIQNLAIVAPSFVTDCLETCFELKHQQQQVFTTHGGKQFSYLPCLNENTTWMTTLLHDWL